MALVTGALLAANLDIDYVSPDAAILDQVADAATNLIGYLITDQAVIDEPSACKEAAMSPWRWKCFRREPVRAAKPSPSTSRPGRTVSACG
jgi:hypothetical protein